MRAVNKIGRRRCFCEGTCSLLPTGYVRSLVLVILKMSVLMSTASSFVITSVCYVFIFLFVCLNVRLRVLSCTVNVGAMPFVNDQLFLSLEDEKSTLFVVFEVGEFYDEDLNEMIEECVVEKLTLIPNDTKLLLTRKPSTWRRCRLWEEDPPETIHAQYSTTDFMSSMLKTLCKRWQTLDLISIIQEVLRTKKWEHGSYSFTWTHNLSSTPRLQKADQ